MERQRRMPSRKDFLFLMKPLYWSEFSERAWRHKATNLAPVRDFLPLHVATSRGKIK
jgi:hypothetical protein